MIVQALQYVAYLLLVYTITVFMWRIKQQFCNKYQRSLDKKLERRRILRSDLSLGQRLADGSYGKVFRGGWKGAPVAIKVIRRGKGALNGNDISEEAMLGLAAVHPNIVAVYGMVVEEMHMDGRKEDQTIIVMELCDKGTLQQQRRVGWSLLQQDCYLGLQWILPCLLEIIYGMEHVQDVGIVHGDLKCANILCQSTSSTGRGFSCKVCDFGLSHTLGDRRAIGVSGHGTAVYTAPEVLTRFELAFESDIYSFGIIAWHLLSLGRDDTDLDDLQVFFQVIENGRTPDFPACIPVVLSDIVRSCWAQDYKKRPSFTELRHSLMTVLRSACEGSL